MIVTVVTMIALLSGFTIALQHSNKTSENSNKHRKSKKLIVHISSLKHGSSYNRNI